jgi:uncharacterized BrkB/YihY/UPF0761 family membrane protein
MSFEIDPNAALILYTIFSFALLVLVVWLLWRWRPRLRRKGRKT